MLLSNIKTKTMIFNPLRIYDISPEISIYPGTFTEVVEQQKILGTIIRSDMKTISNTEYICKRAYTRMWILRRLKTLGCSIPELLDVLRQQTLSICVANSLYLCCNTQIEVRTGSGLSARGLAGPVTGQGGGGAALASALNLDLGVQLYFEGSKDEDCYGSIRLQPLSYIDDVIRSSQNVIRGGTIPNFFWPGWF